MIESQKLAKTSKCELDAYNQTTADGDTYLGEMPCGHLLRKYGGETMASNKHGTTERTNLSRFSTTKSPASTVSKLDQDPERNTDEIIANLATMRENRRARQVGEWERLGRQRFWSWA